MNLQLLILAVFAMLMAGLWYYCQLNPQFRWSRQKNIFLQLGAGIAVMAVVMAFDGIDVATNGNALMLSGGMLGIVTLDDVTKTLGDIREKTEGKIAGIDKSIGDAQTAIKAADDRLKKVEGELETQKSEYAKLQKAWLRSGNIGGQVRRFGRVTDECARALGAMFIIGNAKSGRLDLLDTHVRENLFTEARQALNLEAKAALTVADVPLPLQYFAEVRELIQDFGVARQNMMIFPIGQGTAKPPRFKTRPSFGSIAMSAAIAEKSPQIDFASLESHKIGGIVRVPREIDEQSIVPMGQFLARYGAVEFARAEDTWAFLADATGTYENVAGITNIAGANAKRVTMGAGLLSPSETTIAHFRAMRGLVNAAALNKGAKYYLHSTMEAHLRTLNTAADPYIFVPNRPSTKDALAPGNTATLDGFPIVWTDVFPAYTTADVAANAYLAVFGVLEYWWMGEHGSPRMDFSSEVYFANDQLATRFLEEIDFDYQDLGATSALAVPAV